jgi:N-acetylglucosamine-6-phosphate deacetylase
VNKTSIREHVLGISAENGRPVEIETSGGRITAVRESEADPGGVWVAPGLVDLQVNGFAGVDYNSLNTSLEEIGRSIEAIRSTGVTRFLPTVITGPRERMCGALRNLARAKREIPQGASIAGIHVEGPFISPDDGPRGAHPREHVRPADREEFLAMQEAAEGNIRLLTLAPETPGATELIEFLVDQGVVVSLGHTGASPEQIREAIRAGATMSTHLGNGAHPILPRHPNYIWEQMAADELYASFIVDGIHLPQAFLKCAIRAKGVTQSVLVTDASSPAGCSPGSYRLGEVLVELTPEGRVQIAGSQRLAGSALRLDRAVANVMRFTGISLNQAWRMASINAARAVRLEGRMGFLEPGDMADFVLFRFDAARFSVVVEKAIVAA